MIPVSKIIELLETTLVRLRKLEGEEAAGFALIVPPTGEAFVEFTWSTHGDERAFYVMLAQKFAAAKDQAGVGGVRMPGMR